MSGSGRPRGRVTISDIAERAGVSIGAVSFALNGRKGVSPETRDRVLRVAVRHVARLGHRRIARVAGVETFVHTRIRNQTFVDEATVLGLEAVLLRTDYAPSPAAGSPAGRCARPGRRPL